MICPGWCGPIQKQHDCPMANNTQHTAASELSLADLAVIANAGTFALLVRPRCASPGVLGPDVFPPH